MREDRGYVQLTTESKYHAFDWTKDLISGAAILSVSGILTKPDAATFALTDTIISSLVTYGFIPIAQVTQLGDYKLDMSVVVDNAGTLSNETLGWRRHIHVPR